MRVPDVIRALQVGGGRRPRVCHLAYTFYENDNRVIRYAEAIAERGGDVDVIALRRKGQSRTADLRGVRIRRVQRREITENSAAAYLVKVVWFSIKAAIHLTCLQLRKRYDVVHVHNVPDFLVFAAWAPRLMGARIILDIHDILPELYAGKFGVGRASFVFRSLLMVERLSCRFADHVLVANHLWHAKLVKRAVDAHKCTAVLNYPDLRLFKPAPGVEVDAQKFLILYPGTLNHHQGVDIAIEAFALVKDRMPEAEFHIYGEGPARSALVQLIREYGLAGRVKVIDRVPLSQVSAVMASASVGVVPKRGEGFGDEAFSTKILEFMACGVPVIVSRTQIDAHYFDDTLVHFFVPGDADDLARVLLDTYQHRSEDGARVQAARDFAVVHSWQEHVVDYLRVIESLVGTAHQPEAVAG
jgi:glycosyltransferase involved in cell wall biosynthesis